MTPEQEKRIAELQKEIVRDVLDSVQQHITARIDLGHVPATWDGHELRQWLADRFARESQGGLMQGKRLRQYRNTVIVNNL
jgi:hypothetical protein